MGSTYIRVDRTKIVYVNEKKHDMVQRLENVMKNSIYLVKVVSTARAAAAITT